MKLNIGYIKSDNYLDDNVVKEILNDMIGLPLDITDETDDRMVSIRFETTSRSHKNLEILSDGKIVAIFDKEKYQQIVSALCGFWDDRFPPNNLIVNPIITIYIFELVEKIRCAFKLQELPLIQKWFWPNEKSHALCISHDVDILVRQELVQVLNSKIKKMRLTKFLISKVLNRLFKINESEDFGNNIERILTLEKKLDLQSTFFIFSNTKTYKETAPTELILEENFKELIKTLKSASEVGVHGSTHSYKNINSLKKEKGELESIFGDVKGIRQHRLNFIPALTWRYQSQAGYKYDSSVAHSEFFGFFSGICHPYRLIDIIQKQILNLLEIPLSFMDWTFMHYELGLDRIFSIFRTLNSIAKKYHGVFVVNFHNIYYNPVLFPDFYRFYQRISEFISKLDVWKPTLGELCDWWIKRENVAMLVELQKNEILVKLTTSVPVENLSIAYSVKKNEFITLNLKENESQTLKIDI